MLPAQRNKIDISSLSEEEQKAFRLYGKLPAGANVRSNKPHERKYFDSGDYALSKAGKAPQQSVGTAIPNPERVPHASTVVGASVAAPVGGLVSPSATGAPTPMAATLFAGGGGFPATTAAPMPVSPLSSIPPPASADLGASTTTATPLPIGGSGSGRHHSSSTSPSSATSSANAASQGASSLALSPPPSAAQTSTSPLGLGSRHQPVGSFPVASAHAAAAAAAAAAQDSPFPSSALSPGAVGNGVNPAGIGSPAALALGSPATSPGATLAAGVGPRYLHRGSLSGSPGKEASSGLARAQPLSAEDVMEE
ncbi:hypothetical protein OC846_003479 [Tilletia horrida]|uniref:mRNA stability protein n=1 Tax=Tilletia horrida TaxID=155126 RepID=A0AAN6GS28_9BASI|nr:hypothetical protein OC846_003479 [Tilletia horrida]KAK0551328.1 hypothetical protein OC845_002238 [Tilletia horrida]KAK0567968.1 hypothetical protein OC861_002419 [Tilletia horrida]